MNEITSILVAAVAIVTILIGAVVWDENKKHQLRLECIKSDKSLIEKSCVEMRR
jgi:uncharacterized membrane protein YhfC